MNPFSLTGIITVQTALICYSIAIISEQRKRLITNKVLAFLTMGVLLDIVATTFMILGSSRGPFTLHGILGYSSLAGMLTDAILIWRFYRKNDAGTKVTDGIHWYSLGAYIWWVAAYITGALLVALRH
ncbi:MAG: hypothetical protein NT040_06060 [Bacteroidetes bacterium]|nr:hypothetical protein [Bacteroidota bacterium]